MITKYRFGTPILDTEAVIVPQPVAAAYQPGDAPAFPGMSAAVVDANAQTDGSQGWGPAVQKPRKDAWQFTIDLKDGDVVYGLGERPSGGINKRGWLYLSDNLDDMMHTESKYKPLRLPQLPRRRPCGRQRQHRPLPRRPRRLPLRRRLHRQGQAGHHQFVGQL